MIALVDFVRSKNIAVLPLKLLIFILILYTIIGDISTAKSVEIDISPDNQDRSLQEKSTVNIDFKFSDDIPRITIGKIVIRMPSSHCTLKEIKFKNLDDGQIFQCDGLEDCYRIFFSINNIVPNLKYSLEIPFASDVVGELNILIENASFKDENENYINSITYSREKAAINYQEKCNDQECESKNGELERTYEDTDFRYKRINTNCVCGQNGCVCDKKDIIIDILNIDQYINIEPSDAHLHEPVKFRANLTEFRDKFDKYPEISIEYININNSISILKWDDCYNVEYILNNLSKGQQNVKISCLLNSSTNGNCSKSILRNVAINELDGLDVDVSILPEEGYVGDEVNILFICMNNNNYPVSNVTINLTMGPLFSHHYALVNIDRIERLSYIKQINILTAISDGYYIPTDYHLTYKYFGELISRDGLMENRNRIVFSKKPNRILPYLWFLFSFFVGIIAGLIANSISTASYRNWVLLILGIIIIFVLIIIRIIGGL